MLDQNPMLLTPTDWDEVAATREVREGWGLEANDLGSHMALVAYGAKFHFVSGSPGYVGDLYVIVGDGLSAPPMVLIRQQGALRVAEF